MLLWFKIRIKWPLGWPQPQVFWQSEGIFSTPTIFNATFKVFGSQGCSDDRNWLDSSSIFFKICRFRSSICFRCKFSFHEERDPAAPRVSLSCSYHIIFQPRGEISASHFTIISLKKNLKVLNSEFLRQRFYGKILSFDRLMPLPSARQHGKMWRRP